MRRPDTTAMPLESDHLKMAIDSSVEIVFTTDASGTFTYVNPMFEHTYGYESSEVVGRTTPRILKGGATQAEYAAFWSQLRQSRIVTHEFVNRTREGKALPIETSASPIVDGAGETVGFLAVQRDITDRKRMEAALRESELRYRTLAEAAQDSIFIVDSSGRIEYVNEIGRQWFGLSSEAAIGSRLVEVFPAEVARLMWRRLSSVIATRRRQLFEDRFVLPGRSLWLETWLVPMLDDAGDVRAVMGVARDVSGRKSLERQFLQAQKMEIVGRLAAGVAHDFNNLLTAILGYSELLRLRLSDAPDVLADLGEISRAGERASRLTRQLLAFSRKVETSQTVLDVNTVLADIHKMLSRTLGEDIKLLVEPGRDVAEVVAEPGQIEQVIMNLAVNARDAMPKGGQLTIETANADLDDDFVSRHQGAIAGPYVSLVVRDNGCGMSPEILTHVFEPFFTTKPVGRGTGLGLSTIHDIVTQNGGCVTVESRRDAGTAVTVFWPRAGTQRDALAGAGRPVSSPAGGTETILLVEDQRELRSLIRKTLESRGYRVLEAQDAADALSLASVPDRPIDLLLTDVVMPGLNGPDLAQRVVARRPEVRVLIMSGFPSCLPAERARQRARMAFMAKPFTLLELAAKVRECLEDAR